uniref:U1756k n=1 Tax=Mycobacterium leprae TaxID=1769 RepID=Q49954_MYCLR|nr:u1756k [Mycobacterium leprae]
MHRRLRRDGCDQAGRRRRIRRPISGPRGVRPVVCLLAAAVRAGWSSRLCTPPRARVARWRCVSKLMTLNVAGPLNVLVCRADGYFPYTYYDRLTSRSVVCQVSDCKADVPAHAECATGRTLGVKDGPATMRLVVTRQY